MGLMRTTGETTQGALVSKMTNRGLERRIVMLVRKPGRHSRKSIQKHLPNLLRWQFEHVLTDLLDRGQIEYSADRTLVLVKRKK